MSSSLNWSPEQDRALKAVDAWLNDKRAPQIFRLFGYAGSGKTTLAKHFASHVNGKVVYGAFTGKAAQVLRQKGCDGASTIHSLIYKLDDENHGSPKFVLNPVSSVRTAALVIIDECSMVGEDLAKDLLSFGTKILVLGDPFQLPPVNGTGFFTDCEPDFMLHEIHRQAAENPIIRLSMDIRGGKRLTRGNMGAEVLIREGRSGIDLDMAARADQLLCGKNATRRDCNYDIRRKVIGEQGPLPVAGDRLVCLKNNNENGLLNGSIWNTIKSVPSESELHTSPFELVVEAELPDGEGRTLATRVLNACFTSNIQDIDYLERQGFDEFDYGYALTTHKSQGSQWEKVFVIDESRTFREDAPRWLYTAVTRASEKLVVYT